MTTQPPVADLKISTKTPLKISLIIPIYNEGTQLYKLFEQLAEIKKTCHKLNFEIIVVDGNSTDQTPKILQNIAQNWENLQICHSQKGRGLQLKIGANAARGDFLVFLHGDTKITPAYFLELDQLTPTPFSWGCGRLQFDDTALIFKTIAYCSHLRAKFLRACFGDQTIFCSPSLYQQVGGFQNLPIMEDMVFSQAASRISKPILLKSPSITSPRRYHKQGILNTIWRMQKVKFLYSLGTPSEKLQAYYTKKSN